MEDYILPTILIDNANVILDSIKREKEIAAELRIAIYKTIIEKIKIRVIKRYTTFYMCVLAWYILFDIVDIINKNNNIMLIFPMKNIRLVLPELDKEKLCTYKKEHRSFNIHIREGSAWFHPDDYKSRIKWLKICINELEKNNNNSAI